ncbi:hypothetical protein IWZ03DRAFT_93669 [Phyllosticta citriasiana]|uniref:Uncharacterized protein n=1 Tax=Phyllosticta citriasiana TaxID=595635 RepID=A0ABR1K7M0_9PEZI
METDTRCRCVDPGHRSFVPISRPGPSPRPAFVVYLHQSGLRWRRRANPQVDPIILSLQQLRIDSSSSRSGGNDDNLSRTRPLMGGPHHRAPSFLPSIHPPIQDGFSVRRLASPRLVPWGSAQLSFFSVHLPCCLLPFQLAVLFEGYNTSPQSVAGCRRSSRWPNVSLNAAQANKQADKQTSRTSAAHGKLNSIRLWHPTLRLLVLHGAGEVASCPCAFCCSVHLDISPTVSR